MSDLPPGPIRPTPHAQHRDLTIMMLHLAPSSTCISEIDIEELRFIVHTYQAVCTLTVKTRSGFVARRTGHEILVYFGYVESPHSGADDALAAAADVLSHPWIRSVAGVSEQAASFSLHVGVASGRVLVARRPHAIDGADHEVVGRAVNLAARLRAHAPANSAFIDDDTVRRGCGDLSNLTPVGEQSVKGLSAPIRIWQMTA